MYSSSLLLAAAGLAAAHFQIEYPSWRANSLSSTNYSQYEYPCAGVPSGAWGSNRTDWPIAGGSLSLDLHHPWTYIFINIGLGDNVTNFNYTLTPSFWNETGSGVLCVPHLDLPEGLTPGDGQRATMQIVTLGESGSALYNCADITFRESVADFGGDNCTTDAAVSYYVVDEQSNTTDGGAATAATVTVTVTASAGAGASRTATSGAASPLHVGLASVAVLAAFVCFGL